MKTTVYPTPNGDDCREKYFNDKCVITEHFTYYNGEAYVSDLTDGNELLIEYATDGELRHIGFMCAKCAKTKMR